MTMNPGVPIWSVTLPLARFCEDCRATCAEVMDGTRHGFVDLCVDCRSLVAAQVSADAAAAEEREAAARETEKKRAREALERPWRDTVIWLMRRGDGMALSAIAEAVNLSVETVRVRVRLIDVKLTRGWRDRSRKTPAWLRRLRSAGAVGDRHWTTPPYEAFNSTAPAARRRPR